MTAARAAFEGVIDYAGLYPPASLPLDAVVQNYADYRRGAHGAQLLLLCLLRQGILAHGQMRQLFLQLEKAFKARRIEAPIGDCLFHRTSRLVLVSAIGEVAAAGQGRDVLERFGHAGVG